MPDEIKNINQPDVLSESIKQKLGNHELPVDAECWNEIEARMNAETKKKVIPFWFWISGGVAVATLALLFMLHPLAKQEVYVSKARQRNSQKNYIQTNKIFEKPIQNITSVIKVNSSKVLRATNQPELQENTNAKQTENIVEMELPLVDTHITNAIINNETTENKDNNAITNTQIAETSTADNNSIAIINSKKHIPTNLTEKPEKELISKTKKKNDWLLAASFGSGSSASLSGSNDLYLSDAGNNVGKNIMTNANTSYSNILTPNDFTQKNFMSPLSFGLIARKALNKTISLETGLVYTYLLSTFEKQGITSYDASLKLHYLGVPLNLVAQVWKNHKWEVYISGGGMTEKGLRSVYIQNQYTGSQIIKTSARTKIDGLQWSLNGAAGTTYKLQRNLGIYFEPKISYFFDNNQPISARSDQPFVVGLTAGLRYQF